MPREKVVAELLGADDVIDVDVGGRQPNTAAEQQEDEWADFLGTAGETAVIYVYRQPGNGQSAFEFVDSFPADQFEPSALMKRLRQEFGGGNYRVQIRHGGRVKANKLMAVAAPLNLPGKQTGGDPALMAMLEEMREMRREMLAEKKAEHKSPLDQIKEMAALASVMREAFGVGAQKSVLTELRDLMAIQSEFRGLMGGEEKEESGPGWVGPLLNALPTLLQAAMQRPVPVHARPNPVPRRPVHDVKPESVKPEGEKTVIDALNPHQKQLISQYLGKAVTAAQWGISSETVADKVLDAIDDKQSEEIAGLLQVPNLLDEAIKLVPDIAAYRPWFEDVVEWLKAGLGLDSKYSGEFDDPEDEVVDAAPTPVAVDNQAP